MDVGFNPALVTLHSQKSIWLKNRMKKPESQFVEWQYHREEKYLTATDSFDSKSL